MLKNFLTSLTFILEAIYQVFHPFHFISFLFHLFIDFPYQYQKHKVVNLTILLVQKLQNIGVKHLFILCDVLAFTLLYGLATEVSPVNTRSIHFNHFFINLGTMFKFHYITIFLMIHSRSWNKYFSLIVMQISLFIHKLNALSTQLYTTITTLKSIKLFFLFANIGPNVYKRNIILFLKSL
jgi:hypothetical protein